MCDRQGNQCAVCIWYRRNDYGSVSAIKESNIRRMISYSSIAQIGYIYMGFGLGTTAGIVASIYHIVSHAATKALLFVAASGITEYQETARISLI